MRQGISRTVHRLAVALAIVVAGGLVAPRASNAQFIRGGAVGGVFIDADGVLTAPERANTARLQAEWQAGLDPVPGDLQKLTELRYVSLRGVEAQLATAAAEGQPVPDSVRYLAGLLRVKFVLIYPPTDEQPEGDIVLAGPAEGWVVDALGNTVGKTTRRPVLYYEDLMVALRSAEGANGNGISCSIDPTPEGLQRVARVGRSLDPAAGPAAAARRMEQALGLQVISVAGVPASSHFARTLVAADFRMKRIAMGFDPAPIDGLPSYLALIPKRATSVKNMMPRWWMAPSYEPLRTDEQGLAWELRGVGVKCLTEESIADQAGNLTRTGKAGPFATKWAELMTKHFDELCGHDSAFGHLRNAIDLAVVGALIAKEDALGRANLSLPWLAGKQSLEEYPAPKTVATQVSFVRKRGGYILSASGGVQFYPWEVADRAEKTTKLAPVRSTAAAKATSSWWWQ